MALVDGRDVVQPLHLAHGLENWEAPWSRVPTPGEQKVRGIDAASPDRRRDAPGARARGVSVHEPTVREFMRGHSFARARQALPEGRRPDAEDLPGVVASQLEDIAKDVGYPLVAI